MTTYLTADQKFDWLSSTLLELSSLPNLSDEDFAFEIFEELDINAHSALSKENIDFLISAHRISEATAKEVLLIREMFLSKVTTLHSSESYNPEVIREDTFWADISKRSKAVLNSVTN